MRGTGSNDCAGSGIAGSYPSAGGGAAAVGASETGAVSEGPVEPDAAGGVSAPAQAVLGQHLWARGYFCATVGAVDEKTIQEYIENQRWDEDAESFKITAPRVLKPASAGSASGGLS